MIFHPVLDILVVIWSDGVLRSWNSEKGTISSQMSPHSVQDHSFLNLVFTQSGTRLITTDHVCTIHKFHVDFKAFLQSLTLITQRGVVSIWSCKDSGSLNLMYTFKLKHGCSHVTSLGDIGGDFSRRTESEGVFESAFYMASNEGKIYVATDDGHCNDILQLDPSDHGDFPRCCFLQYLVAHRKLICITDDLTLSLYDVTEDDPTQLAMSKSFKLSMAARDSATMKCIHLFHGLLAVANEQPVVRLFDVIHNDNYILSLTDPRHKAAPNDTIDSVRYIPSSRVLIGVTAKSRVVQWKYRRFTWSNEQLVNESTDDRDWMVLPPITLSQTALSIDGGLSSHFYSATDLGLAVFVNESRSESAVTSSEEKETDQGELLLFCETKLHCIYSEGRTVIQFAPNRLLLFLEDDKMKKIRTPFTILIIAYSGNSVFLSDGEQAQLYSVHREGPPIKVREWKEMRCSAAALHSFENISKMTGKWNNNSQAGVHGVHSVSNPESDIQVIVSHHSNIRIYSSNGALRTTLTFQDVDGFPVAMDVKGSLLAVVTTENYLKVWDLGGDSLSERNQNTPKAVVPRRSLDEYVSAVKAIRINADGSKISIVGLSADNMHHLTGTFHVYDIDRDQCLWYRLQGEVAVEELIWDQLDGRLLSASWRKINDQRPLTRESSTESEDVESERMDLDAHGDGVKTHRMNPKSVLDVDGSKDSGIDNQYGVSSFFVTADGQVVPQETFTTKWKYVGLQVPNFVMVSVPNSTDSVESQTKSNGIPRVIRQKLRDFQGIDKVDEETRLNLMNFSYHLTVGDLDEAYRSVQNIRSCSIWENMARMCVKTKRLDVAQICISNLSSSRGSSTRIASSLFTNNADDPDGSRSKDSELMRLAMIAIDLEMYKEAEQLLKECGRFDVVVKMYQALGNWQNAVAVAEQHDRVNLRAAYYQYAEYLQESGDIDGAVPLYEKAQSPLQIAHMLHQHQRFSLLKKHAQASSDPKLLKWYAQYLESNEDYNGAMPFYEKSGDYASMVRLCCEMDDIPRALQVVKDSQSLGAAFHLASFYEDTDRIHEAIEYYKQSEAYHHALRLAKEHQLDELLVDIALKVPDSVLTTRSNPKEIAARYFEDIGDLSKAVMLYQKAGNVNKAMDICIEGQLFDALRSIASSLTDNNGTNNLDPNVAERFAEYFLEHEQYEKAVQMLITAQQHERALDIITRHAVAITKELAEQLTPPRTNSMTTSDRDRRRDVLQRLAQCLSDQQQYQLACKKYTQCGDKIKAIQCLIKAGDSKKVMHYAAKTKSKEACILAANYLQSLDWHSNAEYTKAILQFYNTAKAHEQLAFFYDAMAQIEIDEYRDYDKALRALKQAFKMIKKSSAGNKEEIIQMFEQKVLLVNRFASARKLAESDPTQMIAICEALIKESNPEAGIRVGDVYALMVEYYHSIGNHSEAYTVIQRMKESDIILGPYLDQSMVDTIHQTLGLVANDVDERSEELITENIVDECE